MNSNGIVVYPIRPKKKKNLLSGIEHFPSKPANLTSKLAQTTCDEGKTLRTVGDGGSNFQDSSLGNESPDNRPHIRLTYSN